MKLLKVTRIKVMTSKGRIEKDETVVLPDDEYSKIVFMTPDAFEVLDDNFVEAPAPKPRRKRKVEAAPVEEAPAETEVQLGFDEVAHDE